MKWMGSEMRRFLVFFTVVLVCSVVGGLYGAQVAAESDSDGSAVQQSLRSISKVLRAVEENYAAPIDAEKAIYNGAIPGMLRSLDPHSNFFDPRASSCCAKSRKDATTASE